MCQDLAAGVLPASCLEQLDSANWKDRLASMEEFQRVKSSCSVLISCVINNFITEQKLIDSYYPAVIANNCNFSLNLCILLGC